MFKSKTVMVVGAGASAELGLPVGDELTVQIGNALNHDFVLPLGSSISPHLSAFHFAFEQLSNSPSSDVEAERRRYIGAANQVARAMRLVRSIDAYLDSRRDSWHVERAGKLGIAWAIARAEKTSLLSGAGSPINSEPNFAQKDLRSSWHRQLLNLLIEGLSQGNLPEMFENLSFIIFNYDRCIEHYLHTTLKVIYPDVSDDFLAEVLNRTSFIHPYGVIGRLPWQLSPDPVIAYGAVLKGPQLLEASSGLNTYTQGINDTALRDKMKATLKDAHTCIFLGFSFQPQNMDLLSIPERGNLQRIYGTSFGISESDVEICQLRIDGAFSDNYIDDTRLPAIKCNELFKTYSQSLAD
jgi:hypothetical protein